MTPKQQGSLIAGVVVVIIAIIFYNFVTDDTDDATTTGGNNDITCTMTAAAVPLFAAAVREGRAATAIGGIAGVATVAACKSVLTQLQSSPDAPVPMLVKTPQDTVQQQVTLPDLTVPPAQPAAGGGVTVSTLIACGQSYRADTESLLLRLCYDGVLAPRGG